MNNSDICYQCNDRPGGCWRAVSCNIERAIARNKQIKQGTCPIGKWIIFVDPDITIDEKSKLTTWLALPHALGACRSELAGGSWLAPQAWHTGLCFIRSEVFGKLEKPWFDPFIIGGKCGCMRFRDKAIMAGFHSAHAGWVKHDHAGTWH